MELEIKGLAHPDYDSETIANDIGIIKFKTPIKFVNDYISPICLGVHDDYTQYKTCYITGWGHTDEGVETFTNISFFAITLFNCYFHGSVTRTV